MTKFSNGGRFEVLGIWVGSPSRLSHLQREGIFRFLFNLVKHLMMDSSLRVEVWCQHGNLGAVRELFAELSAGPPGSGRIAFCTDRSAGRSGAGKAGAWRRRAFWLKATAVHGIRSGIFSLLAALRKFRLFFLPAAALLSGAAIYLVFRNPAAHRSPLGILFLAVLAAASVAAVFFRGRLEWSMYWVWDLFKQSLNLLPQAANRYSEADCFLVQNFDMANAWKLGGLKIVNLHDLYTSEFAALFDRPGFNRRQLFQGIKARRFAERLARDGAFFVSNSDHIRRTHALAMIRGLREENTGFILLPAIVPEGIRQRLRERRDILEAFRIGGDYIFYPTQVRPHKNVITLLKALAIVLAAGLDLKLVLTGSLATDPQCLRYSRRNRLRDSLVLTGAVSEQDMYSLYRHAALAVVPTLSEGGFPWQGLEAMAMETPVVMSRIPVVEERLRYHGLPGDAAGLQLFEPLDENDLAGRILHVCRHRDQVQAEQRMYRDVLLAYDWHQLAGQYLRLFQRLLARSANV